MVVEVMAFKYAGKMLVFAFRIAMVCLLLASLTSIRSNSGVEDKDFTPAGRRGNYYDSHRDRQRLLDIAANYLERPGGQPEYGLPQLSGGIGSPSSRTFKIIEKMCGQDDQSVTTAEDANREVFKFSFTSACKGCVWLYYWDCGLGVCPDGSEVVSEPDDDDSDSSGGGGDDDDDDGSTTTDEPAEANLETVEDESPSFTDEPLLSTEQDGDVDDEGDIDNPDDLEDIISSIVEAGIDIPTDEDVDDSTDEVASPASAGIFDDITEEEVLEAIADNAAADAAEAALENSEDTVEPADDDDSDDGVTDSVVDDDVARLLWGAARPHQPLPNHYTAGKAGKHGRRRRHSSQSPGSKNRPLTSSKTPSAADNVGSRLDNASHFGLLNSQFYRIDDVCQTKYVPVCTTLQKTICPENHNPAAERRDNNEKIVSLAAREIFGRAYQLHRPFSAAGDVPSEHRIDCRIKNERKCVYVPRVHCHKVRVQLPGHSLRNREHSHSFNERVRTDPHSNQYHYSELEPIVDYEAYFDGKSAEKTARISASAKRALNQGRVVCRIRSRHRRRRRETQRGDKRGSRKTPRLDWEKPECVLKKRLYCIFDLQGFCDSLLSAFCKWQGYQVPQLPETPARSLFYGSNFAPYVERNRRSAAPKYRRRRQSRT